MAKNAKRPTVEGVGRAARVPNADACDLCGRDDCRGLYEVRDNDASHFYLVGAECMRKAALAALEKAGFRLT